MKQEKASWIGRIDDTALGPIWLATGDEGLVAISLWPDQRKFEAEVARLTGSQPMMDSQKTRKAGDQLVAYLNKERQEFDLDIDWSIMTPFQQLTLKAVHAIPYGRLSSYGEIARLIGRTKAVRAVGRANATNPIPIVIPCHRVLGADGKLHGYGAPGGLETKAWLLRLEGSWLL